MLNNRFRLQRGSLRLPFRLDDKGLVYPDIRKNGSSAFKMELGFEPHWGNVSELAEHTPWQVSRRHGASNFVWRNLVEASFSYSRNAARETAPDSLRTGRAG
jgi:hypothetical protein